MSSFQTKLMELWSSQHCYTFLRSLILNLIFIPFLLGICKENKIPTGVWEILTLLIPSSVREGWRLWWMMQGWHSLSKDTNSAYLSPALSPQPPCRLLCGARAVWIRHSQVWVSSHHHHITVGKPRQYRGSTGLCSEAFCTLTPGLHHLPFRIHFWVFLSPYLCPPPSWSC